MDALIALSIILVAVLGMNVLYISEKQTSNLHFASDDFISALGSLKLSEVNNSYVQQLISNGTIKDENNTVLQQIGDFWAADQTDLARNLTAIFAEKLIPPNQGVGVYISGQAIYERGLNDMELIANSQRLISGIAENKSKTGFIARASVVKAKKNNTLIVMGDVISSSVRKPWGSNNNNKVNITYYVDLPSNATIVDAYWFIEAAWTDNKFKAYINNVYIPGSDASGSKLLTNLNSYLTPGRNRANVVGRYGRGGYEAGDDGASHFVVIYSTDVIDTLEDKTKQYLAEVRSNCSINYKKPIFVYGTLNKLDINLNVIATTVTLKYIVDGVTYDISTKNVVNNSAEWTDLEIRTAMNSDGIGYSDLADRYFWFVFEIDDYHSRENFGIGREIMNNSYVNVDATSAENLDYGYIDITHVPDVYSYSNRFFWDFYRNVEWQFDVLNSSIPLTVDSQLAWLYWSGSNPNQKIMSNSLVLYQHPTQPLITELARFGYTKKDGIINGTNSYKLEFSNGYSVNPFNSLIAYTFLVKCMVPYGNTFQTLDEAVDDALNRLNETLGVYIEATEIVNETIALSGVPYLWGPTIIEARLWQ